MHAACTRREFVTRSALLGAALPFSGFLGGLSSPFAAEAPPDLVVVKGTNAYDAARRAVEALGGMRRFVARGDRVGLLINSRFDKPGTYVKPAIAVAVIAMAHEAGAHTVISLENAPPSYWHNATLSREHREYVEALRAPGGLSTISLPRGVNLRRLDIVQDFLDCDVLINMPIFKDHKGTGFTGVLKNIMGATGRETNHFFHAGSGKGEGYADVPFLSQCIADAHLLRKPALCVGDATEVVATNGPFGPGTLIRPGAVVAGTDIVAMDALGTSLLGLRVENVAMIGMAERLDLGTAHVESLHVEHVTL